MNLDSQNYHQPVLPDAVQEYLAPMAGKSYLDLTAGYGGHAAMILGQTRAPAQAVLVDRDQQAITALKARFADPVRILHCDFLTASRQLVAESKRYDMVLADLGVSSPHLDTASRGFAIALDGPLDMRMDQNQTVSAATIVNDFEQSKLQQIIREYGEEPHAGRIAQAIVAHRPIRRTAELAQIVAAAVGRKQGGRIHPATRTFQALRIAVNDELSLLNDSLPLWLRLLAPSGRLVVISFHSLEDRLVKQFLAEHGGSDYDAELHILTKRPVSADHQELVNNPRARSAKLRAAQRK